jgi:hypothetical protein
MKVVPISAWWEGRKVEAAEVEDDCHQMLTLIAQDEGSTVEDVIRGILVRRDLANFEWNGAIRLRFREDEDDDE